MNTTRPLQLILPTDKRNPSFTLYQDDREQQIHVYYGLELLQVVPHDREHVQYKLLVANLYNAGLKVGALEELFGVNRKTMRVWGEALQSGDVQRLARALEGRKRQRKLTPEIKSFIEHRFAEALTQARLELARQQKRWLFVEEQAAAQHLRRQAVIAEREKRLAEPAGPALPEEAKTLACLRRASQRYETHRAERRQKIQTLQQQLEANLQAAATAKKEESRLEQLIALGMRRLDTRNKQLMDAIKITAGNAFRQTLQPFKKAYDNYRDDHDYFRRLTLAGGVLRWTGDLFEVHLLPQVNYPPALQAILATLLENLNAKKPQMPDGSERPLKFYLSERDDFEIRLKTDP